MRHFLQEFVWPDSEWLVDHGDGSVTYWQSELPMNLTVRFDPESRLAKWQMRLEVVNGVQDDAAALEVCNILNGLTCGWAYVCDPGAGSIVAVAALAHPVQWDLTLVRFSEVIRLAGWLSQVTAPWIATRAGGSRVSSGPSTSSSARDVPDTTFFYPQALRARPEWVMDMLWARYPPMDLVAGLVSRTLGSVFADKVTADPQRFLIEVGDPEADTGDLYDPDIAPEYVIKGGFEQHPVFGLAWNVECTFHTLQQCQPNLGNELTWELFKDPCATLLGAWVLTQTGWTYRVSVHAAELRHYEQVRGFPGTNREVLAGVASTARDAVNTACKQAEEPNGADGLFPPNPSCAQEVLLMIRSLAGENTLNPQESDAPADRGPLWLEPVTRLATAVWFNPNGPTCSTLDISEDAEGRNFLALFDRHPFVPTYRVLAEITDEVSLVVALPEALRQFTGPSTPHALSIETCPEGLQGELQRLLLEGYQSLDENLGWTAAVLESTAGRPWDAVSPAPSLGRDSPLLALPEEEQAQAWWRAVTEPKNFLGVFRELPWAWDGAMNMNLSLGNIQRGLFDSEPFVVVFSDIGRQVDDD